MNHFDPRSLKQYRFLQSLELLLQAHDYARELGCTSWDFAVELSGLQALGISANDLRWLLAKGLAEHAVEVAVAPGQHRTFGLRRDWVLEARSCFILTPAGVAFAQQQLESEGVLCLSLAQVAAVKGSNPQPNWDQMRRTLCYQENVVKQYKVPAPNQELILAAFEEEDWPYRIDDPLPQVQLIEPKRRLHDTINALNRHHRTPSLRFMGDGQGEGICWEPIRRLG